MTDSGPKECRTHPTGLFTKMENCPDIVGQLKRDSTDIPVRNAFSSSGRGRDRVDSMIMPYLTCHFPPSQPRPDPVVAINAQNPSYDGMIDSSGPYANMDAILQAAKHKRSSFHSKKLISYEVAAPPLSTTSMPVTPNHSKPVNSPPKVFPCTNPIFRRTVSHSRNNSITVSESLNLSLRGASSSSRSQPHPAAASELFMPLRVDTPPMSAPPPQATDNNAPPHPFHFDNISITSKCKASSELMAPAPRGETPKSSLTLGQSRRWSTVFDGHYASLRNRRRERVSPYLTSPLCIEEAGPFSGLPYKPGWEENIFRKNNDIKRVLKWQKEAVTKPLLLATPRSLKKEAVENFKHIQKFMGDRRSNKPPGELLFKVVQLGKIQPLLRDEIFMQLCKQVTENQDQTSCTRGWELLCSCVNFYPPSDPFASYVIGFMERHVASRYTNELNNCAIVKLAAVALKRLHRGMMYNSLPQWSPHAHLTVGQVQAALNAIHNPPLFGSSLDEIMLMQSDRHPQRHLPWILITLVTQIFLKQGHQQEGLFSIPPDRRAVKQLRESCEKWNSVIDCPDAFTPASLLLEWLAELSEPVIPIAVTPMILELARSSLLYRRHNAALSSTGWNMQVLEQALELVQIHIPANHSHHNNDSSKSFTPPALLTHNGGLGAGVGIPLINRRCLAYIVWFMQVLCHEDNQRLNRLSTYSLSSVMGPYLFGLQQRQCRLKQARDLQTEFLQLLVENWDVSSSAVTIL